MAPEQDFVDTVGVALHLALNVVGKGPREQRLLLCKERLKFGSWGSSWLVEQLKARYAAISVKHRELGTFRHN